MAIKKSKGEKADDAGVESVLRKLLSHLIEGEKVLGAFTSSIVDFHVLTDKRWIIVSRALFSEKVLAYESIPYRRIIRYKRKASKRLMGFHLEIWVEGREGSISFDCDNDEDADRMHRLLNEATLV